MDHKCASKSYLTDAISGYTNIRNCVYFNIKGNISKLKRFIDHNDHISQRKLSIKFGYDRTHISKTIKKKTSIKKR